MNKLRDQTLALASILQTTTLVDQLASTGTCDANSNQASLKSLITNSTKLEEVFNPRQDLLVGIAALKVVLGNKTKRIQQIILYALALINLEKKLMKNQTLLNQITLEIGLLKNQDFFDISHANSVARLAQLYKSTLGGLSPRIMVNGEHIYLSNKHTANHIRALLLAGIRAVSLWKSQGGKTWHLLFNKQKILNLISSLEGLNK